MTKMYLPNRSKKQQRIKINCFQINRLNNIINSINNRSSIFFFTFKKLESMFA